MQTTIVALLVMLILAVAWVGLEVRSLKQSIGPVADSPLVRALSGIGT